MHPWLERVGRLDPVKRAALARAISRERGRGALAPEPVRPAARLVAYVAAADPERPPRSEDVRAFLSQRLPPYMVPARIVTLDALPLLPNGKLDRQRLPSLGGVSGDGDAPGVDGASVVAPRDDTEARLARIWSGVLGVDVLSVHDDFFELGGDSLLSIQIVAKARQAGMALRPAMLLQHPTIAQLARVLVPASDAGAGPVEGGEVPLSPIQRWLLEQPLTRPHHWNQSLLLRGATRLDPDVVRRATTHVLDHHDALRSRFVRRAGEWRCEPGARPDPASYEWAASAHPDHAATAVAIQADATYWQGRLDLANGPVFQVVQYDGGDSTWLLLIAHHLVVDVASWSVLVEDLLGACGQIARGEPLRLPAKTASFASWARQLAERTRRGEFGADGRHWLDARGEPPSPLPRDHARGANLAGDRGEVVVVLDAVRTQRLANRRGGTVALSRLTCAALAVTLAEWAGAPEVVIDVEGHGRDALGDEIDVSRTVGWFTSVHPARLRVDGNRPLAEVLEGVTSQLRAVPGTGAGYGALRFLGDDPGTRAALARLDVAEVAFNFLGDLARSLPVPQGFELVATSVGPDRCPDDPRRYLFEVSCWTMAGRLEVAWGFATSVHERDTVERLAGRLVEVLAQASASEPAAEAAGTSGSTTSVGAQAPGGTAVPRREGPAKRRTSGLVPIQPGGSATPVFAVHHGGGSIFGYGLLARHLGPGQPFYGFEEPGLEHGEETLSSVEALAGRYVEQVRAVRPRGPYVLGGFCFGGLVAFEMAQQLTRDGEDVESLVIIDGLAPALQQPAPLSARLAWHAQQMAGRSALGRAAYLGRRVARRLRWEAVGRLMRVNHLVKLGAHHAMTWAGMREPAALRQFWLLQHNGRLSEAYVPRPYDGRVVLIRSHQPQMAPDFHWNRVVSRGVEVCQMATEDHLAMLTEPGVRALAAHLRRVLGGATRTRAAAR